MLQLLQKKSKFDIHEISEPVAQFQDVIPFFHLELNFQQILFSRFPGILAGKLFSGSRLLKKPDFDRGPQYLI